LKKSGRNSDGTNYPRTKNYYQKYIVRKLFGLESYKYFKALKVRILYKMGKSFEISEFLKQIIEKDFVIFDIGANLGQYAIRLARLLGDRGKMICVEPEIENYGFLLRLKRKNKLNNLICMNYAVSDYIGRTVLNIPVIDNGIELDTRATIDMENYYFKYDNYKKQEIDVVTLEKLYSDLLPGRLDIIKSDTEGNDGKVISGALELIKKHYPLILVEESHKEDWLKKLYELDYTPYYVKNNIFLKKAFSVEKGEDKIKYDLLVLIHDSRKEKFKKYILNGN